MSTAEQHGRESARLLLGNALADGRPLPPEVREALNKLLDALSLSEDNLYAPEREGDAWQASAWRTVVGYYRRLLTEVRENAASVESREGAAT